MDNTHDRVKKILYSQVGITLLENKEIMINNRLQKLQRDTDFTGDISSLLDEIENGKYVTEFINSFTTNKTNFFREGFHFEDLKNRVCKDAIADNKDLQVWCSASSTGEEPYSIAITIKEATKELNGHINTSIIATDIDTNVLQSAANGIYRFSKSSQEFPSWIKIENYFKKRIEKKLTGDEMLIRVKDDIKRTIEFGINNLNDDEYPFKDNQFDVIFCRNVLIYFTPKDQDTILRKLFRYLKIGGTLYLGHSESPQDIINYSNKVGQNIFIKQKEIPLSKGTY